MQDFLVLYVRIKICKKSRFESLLRVEFSENGGNFHVYVLNFVKCPFFCYWILWNIQKISIFNFPPRKTPGSFSLYSDKSDENARSINNRVRETLTLTIFFSPPHLNRIVLQLMYLFCDVRRKFYSILLSGFVGGEK